MKVSPNAEVKTRLIGGTRSAEGISYQIPRPFSADDVLPLVSALAEAVECDPAGLANALDQTLAENIANNKGAQIKNIREFNETLAEAQEAGTREDEEAKDYPTQAEIDEYITKYNFSGAGREAGDSATLTVRERELWKLAKRTIRDTLRGAGIKVMPKESVVEDENTQISWDDFVDYAAEIVNKEGIWADPNATEVDPVTGEAVPVYFNKCQEIHDLADQAEKAASASAMNAGRLFKKAA